MSRLAAILMFLAWLLYGAMPATAMPPVTPATVEQAAPAPQHDDHGRHAHGGKAETDGAAHSHGNTQQPCPHGGKTCVAPFCAACLTLLPEIAIGDGNRFVYAYPAPGIAQTLASPDPAPLTPPPRA